MLTRILIAWVVYAGIVGFVVGGTFVSAWLEAPHTQIDQNGPGTENQTANTHSKEKADEPLARYTLWLTIFTGILALATIGLGIATVGLYATGEKQIEALQQQFLATHRPKIRTKHVVLSTNLLEKVPLKVNVTLINDGTSDATIFEFGIKFYVEKPTGLLPPISKYRCEVTKIHGLTLASGVSTTFHDVGDGTILADGFDIGRGSRYLYCCGYVHYVDGGKRVRTTAFCRRLVFPDQPESYVDTGRFRVFDDPDYEYES